MTLESKNIKLVMFQFQHADYHHQQVRFVPSNVRLSLCFVATGVYERNEANITPRLFWAAKPYAVIFFSQIFCMTLDCDNYIWWVEQFVTSRLRLLQVLPIHCSHILLNVCTLKGLQLKVCTILKTMLHTQYGTKIQWSKDDGNFWISAMIQKDTYNNKTA